VDELLATLLRLGLETLPISALGWLGLWLLSASGFSDSSRKSMGFGGPWGFLIVWGVAVFVNFKAVGIASPVIHAFYISLFALGLLVSLARLVVRAVLRTSKRR